MFLPQRDDQKITISKGVEDMPVPITNNDIQINEINAMDLMMERL